MNSSIYVAVFILGAMVDGHQNKGPDRSSKLVNSDQTEKGNKSIQDPGLTKLSDCDSAILSCCADIKQKQKQCFNTVGCGHAYNKGAACNPNSILKVLETFNNPYAANSNITKNRVKRWQYTSEQPPTWYQERSYSNHNDEQYLPRIVDLLEEIKTYVKKPQHVIIPHPIYSYIRYPVSYAVPQTYADINNDKLPDIRSRGPDVDDNPTLKSVKDKEDDGNDGARPISFVPIKPERALKRLAPKVEHGSKQYDADPLPSQTSSSASDATSSKEQDQCSAAVLACCIDDKKQQKNCFYNFGCGVPYDNGNACKPESIKAAFDSYKTK